MTHVSTPLSPAPGPRWLYLVVYFVREYHDFLICLDLSQCRRDCRIRGSPSSAIGRRWKTSRQIYIHILALNEFSQSIFFLQEEGFQVRTTLSLFTVNARRLRQLPSVDMSMPNRHAQLRIGPIVRRVRNTDIRNAYQKSSHIYLRLLLDIRTSSYALNHIQTMTMVYAIRGPAGTLTQATIYYFVWKGSFFLMF